jgi:hydrogenase/urease accessory protein HupE
MKRITAIFAIAPSAVLAHPGDHSHVGLLHLLTEPDHLAMIALGVAALVYIANKFRARS